MWKQIGMDVRLESLERLAADQKVLSGNFDLDLNRSALMHADPEQDLLAMYGRGGGANYSGLHSDEIYGLMDALHAEMDPAKRKGEFVRVEQMVNNGYFDSSLIRTPTKEVASKRLHGLRRDGTGIWLYQEMWLDH
jgi:peptide/nickel transport system substrate-binding protein